MAVGKRQKSSDAQVKKHWGMVNATTMSAIADYCVGRSAKDVAKLIGVDSHTVREKLHAYGISYAVTGEGQSPPSIGKVLTIRRVRELFKLYAPKKASSQRINEFIEEGFDEGDVAQTLAIAWTVAEKAIKAGVVFEYEDTGDIEIDIPVPWKIEIQSVASKVRQAAEFLNEAKMSDLKKEVTHKEIMGAHEEWMFQIERLENLRSNA